MDQNSGETSQDPLGTYPATSNANISNNKPTRMDCSQHSSIQSDSESESTFKTPRKQTRKTIKRKIKPQEKKTKSITSDTESELSQNSQQGLICKNKDPASDDSAPFKMKKRRIHDSNNASITHPSGSNNKTKTSPPGISIKNKYQSLNGKAAENNDMHQEPQQTNEDRPQTQTIKKNKTPSHNCSWPIRTNKNDE